MTRPKHPKQRRQAGWVITSHANRIMSHTFSAGKAGAMRRCMSTAEARYGALLPVHFERYRSVGYEDRLATKIGWLRMC